MDRNTYGFPRPSVPLRTNPTLVANLLLGRFSSCFKTLGFVYQRRVPIGDDLLAGDLSGLNTAIATRSRAVAPRVRRPLGFARDLRALLTGGWFVVDVAEAIVGGL